MAVFFSSSRVRHGCCPDGMSDDEDIGIPASSHQVTAEQEPAAGGTTDRWSTLSFDRNRKRRRKLRTESHTPCSSLERLESILLG